ncbi:MAG: ATP-binding protein, partial [Pelovirga sp.]
QDPDLIVGRYVNLYPQLMTSGHQLRVKVDVTSHDEVGVLAEAFNQMVEELSRRRERLLRTMQALRRSRKEIISERNFKNTLFENIETGLITFSSDGHVTSANGSACRILHMSRPTDNPVWQQLLNDWPELKSVLDNWFNNSDCGRVNSRPVYVPIERKGRKLTYRIALFPLSFRQQDGWLLTIEDLTERVNMRQQMARMDRLASLGRMSAGIAHEVRNPLTGVSLLLDELHDRLLGQQTDQLLIRRALEEIERLETLVSQMLRFSAAKAPKLHDSRIDEVLHDSIFLLRNQCQRQQVKIIEQIAGDLPVLLLDADRIKQVILNLLNNALDAMPNGGELSISAEQVNNNILITIADTGEGINADQLPLVFEPFFTTKGQGTGLGLSICHNIITEHGGNIQIESKLQQGTRVQIILPLTVDLPVSVNESS